MFPYGPGQLRDTPILKFLVAGGIGKGYEERIVGGTVPPGGKYPSLVRISRISADESLAPYCAGCILNRDWILSSAS